MHGACRVRSETLTHVSRELDLRDSFSTLFPSDIVILRLTLTGYVVYA